MNNNRSNVRWLHGGLVAFALIIHTACTYGEDITFPEDMGVINVRDYGARGDGKHDDTEALRRAIAETGGRRTLYLPDGVYLISDTVETRNRNGKGWVVFLSLQGQSTDGTIIKIKDNSPAFADASKPAPMLRTRDGNMAFRYRFSHFTLDTGERNPGATGIAFISCNLGSLMHVNVRSGDPDGEGAVGIDCTGSNPGLSLVKHVTVSGFDVGIDFGSIYPGMAFEHVTLRGQKTAGFRADGTNGAAIRGLTSENQVPALVVGNKAQVVLIDSDLRGRGTAGDSAAIVSRDEGQVLVRNTSVSGYGLAIRDEVNEREIAEKEIDEYVSQPAASLFASTGRSLGLKVAETPELPWDAGDDFVRWENVRSHGALGDGKTDDTAAIEKALAAANAAGKHTVYFPQGTYKVSRTLTLRGTVRRLVGMPSQLEPIHKAAAWPKHGSFAGNAEPIILRIEGDSPTVVIDRLSVDGTCEHAAANDVVFRLGQGLHYRNTVTCGRAFFEDYGARYEITGPQHVYARLWNPTWGNATYPHYRFNPDDPAYARNDGGTLWIMGVDHESGGVPHVMLRNLNGAKTEILGLLDWKNRPVSRMFENIDSQVSIAALRTQTGVFPTEVRDGWRRGEKFGKQVLIVADLPEAGDAPTPVGDLVAKPTGDVWPFNMKLTWNAPGADSVKVSGYEVRRDGQRLGYTTQTQWVDPAMQDDTEHRYEVIALSDALVRSKAAEAMARTPKDTVRLEVEAVYATNEPAQVHVVFSKPVNAATATAADACLINGEPPMVATLQADLRTATYSVDAWKGEAPHEVTVTGVRDRARSPQALAATTRTVEPVAEGQGLFVSYFADESMAGEPKARRLSPRIAQDWKAWAPVPEVAAKRFALRLTGRLRADYSEAYTFNIESADGVRLWIDDRLVFDTWDEAQSFTESKVSEVNWRDAQPVSLVAGKLHDIRLELRKYGSDAWLALRWSSVSQEREVVPTSSLYLPTGENAEAIREAAASRFTGLSSGTGVHATYHAHPYQNRGKWTRRDAAIDFAFGTEPPPEMDGKLKGNWYKIEWHGWLRAEKTGWHSFGVDLGQKNAADVFVDGYQVVGAKTWWGKDRQTREGQRLWLHAGDVVPLYVFYRQEDGNSLIELWWEGPDDPRRKIPTRLLYPTLESMQP